VNDELILGFIVGAILGGSAFYLLRASEKEKKLFFKKIERVASEIDKNWDLFEGLAKQIPAGRSLSSLLKTAAAGMKMYQKGR